MSGAVSLVYSTFLGGTTGDSSGNGIAVDQKGLIYVIGATKATDFPLTDSAYQSVTWGAQDAFLCQIDPNAGVLNYSTYLGGELADQGRAIRSPRTAWYTLRFPRNPPSSRWRALPTTTT